MTGVPTFDVNKMIDGMAKMVSNVQTYLNQLEQATGGSVALGRMFHMQFMMEMMSQYIEAVSNVLQAIHSEMMTMARATKGQ